MPTGPGTRRPRKPRGTTRGTRGAAAAVLAAALLGGCGGDGGDHDGGAAGAEAWRTLTAGGVSVDYPPRFTTADDGGADHDAHGGQAGVTGAAASAYAEIEHVYLAAVSVHLIPLDAEGLEEGVAERLGTEPGERQTADVPGAERAWRAAYRLDAVDEHHPPVAGTEVEGSVVAGEAPDGTGFAIRIDGVSGALDPDERERIADSVRLTGAEAAAER
ncbi:hypothetical protein [Streptomyces sp. URMC 129]|uniref:hypothetical protein n=1 Tax=Streptomyces sp. URMC 129 TaxID=3423407 RepID=UPI003F19F302